MIEFLAHDVGNVERDQGPSGPTHEVENFVARKTVGGFLELAALPLLHVSPMTVLAIISDVAYGSQTYLNELSSALKDEGIIAEDSTIDHASDLLTALNQSSATAADALDTPPLSVKGLAETIRQVSEAAQSADVTRAIPQAEVERLWTEMHTIAGREHQGMLQNLQRRVDVRDEPDRSNG